MPEPGDEEQVAGAAVGVEVAAVVGVAVRAWPSGPSTAGPGGSGTRRAGGARGSSGVGAGAAPWPESDGSSTSVRRERSRRPGRRLAPMEDAAFFDLDRTLLTGASGPMFSTMLKRVGLLPDRSIPGEGLVFKFFDVVGETHPVDAGHPADGPGRLGVGPRAGAGGGRAGRRAAGRRGARLRQGADRQATRTRAARWSWPPPRPTTW